MTCNTCIYPIFFGTVFAGVSFSLGVLSTDYSCNGTALLHLLF